MNPPLIASMKLQRLDNRGPITWDNLFFKRIFIENKSDSSVKVWLNKHTLLSRYALGLKLSARFARIMQEVRKKNLDLKSD